MISRFARNRVARGCAQFLAVAGLLPMLGCADAVPDFLVGGPAAPERLTGFIGGVSADEPRAATLARDVLAAGGNAADAATALGFALAVTLPSRAGLGGGGACLAYNPDPDGPGHGVPEAILFQPVPPANPGTGSDRPASVPMLARGLYALHARYGHRQFETLVVPAEQMARFGVGTSRALAHDIADVAGPLQADPNMRAVFAPKGKPLGEGDQLMQPDLGSTLAQLRTAGVGDLYQGGLASRFADASVRAGGAITVADLRAALPRTDIALVQQAGRDQVAFLPDSGGLGAAAALAQLNANKGVDEAGRRALAAIARWRQGKVDMETVLKANDAAPTDLGPLPASTGFVVVDRQGGAVSCALTMDNLFGTGRIAPGTGVVMAASPASKPHPLLAAAIAWNANLNAFRAAVAGSGQQGAALAVGYAMYQVLHGTNLTPAPDPGRVDFVSCGRYLPGSAKSCGWVTDPRGYGLAIGSD